MRCLCLLATATLMASGAQAEHLTLAQALERARMSAPSVTAKKLEVAAARDAAIPAGALPDPRGSVGVTDFPISGPLAGRPNLDNFTMLSFGLSQDVPSLAKRRAREETARANIGVAVADETAETRATEVAAGQAWVGLYYAERKLAALQTLATALAQEQSTAPARLASGTDRPALSIAPQQLLAALDDRGEALRAQVLEARANLELWVGDDAALEPTGPPPDLEINTAGLRAHLDDLPALQVAAAKVRQAEAAAGEARADTHPDWGYQIQYDHRDPRFGDYISGGVNFSLPLFAKTRQDPIIDARVEQLNAAVAQQAQTRRALQAALDGALAQYDLHKSQLTRARDVFVPLAKQRAELEMASYSAQSASLTDVMAARRDEVDAELAVLDRESETAAQVVALTLTYGNLPQ